MNRTLSLIVFAALCIAAGNAHAERIGAQLGTGEDTLESRIEFPELRGDTSAILRCAARVEDSGKLADNGCVVNSPADQVFAEPINKAAKKARMVPAVADGREQEVYFQYRVGFIQKGDERTVKIYPNPGVEENVDAYGPDHVAAQRAIGAEKWQDVCPETAQYLVWLKAHVAEDGTPSNLSLTHGAGLNPSPRCQQAILDSAAASVFFPALADGEPVPSTYVEPYGN